MTQKIFIAIPVYGGMPVQFVECLMRFQNSPTVACEIKFLGGDSLVSRARNTLTRIFLESDCTHLLFIDSDLIFSGEQIARMVSHDVPLVAGFYPKKKDGGLEWVCNANPAQEPTDARGLASVKYMGTGFMLVKREVFEQMKKGVELSAWDQFFCLGEPPVKHQAREYIADDSGAREWDFWSVGVHEFADGTRRYLSEDWAFCQRWLDHGGKVYGDTRVILKHIGQAIYPLQSQQSAIHASPVPNAA